MQLVDNAGKVVRYAYSFWGMILAGLADLSMDYIPYLADVLPKRTVFAIIVVSIIARLIKQETVSGKTEEAADDTPIGI